MSNPSLRKRLQGNHFAKTKLTEVQVRKIRALRTEGEKLRTIADCFGIHISSVQDICNRVTWKHIE